MRRYGNIPVSFYLIRACAAPPSPDPKVGTVEPFYSKLREEYLSVAFETAAKSMCDLATSYSELQQLRKQVEEAEKRQAIVLANDFRRKPSRAVQDLAAFSVSSVKAKRVSQSSMTQTAGLYQPPEVTEACWLPATSKMQ